MTETNPPAANEAANENPATEKKKAVKVSHKINGKLIDFMDTKALQDNCKEREIPIEGLNREQLLAALKAKLNEQVTNGEPVQPKKDTEKTNNKEMKKSPKKSTAKKSAKKAAPKAKAVKKAAGEKKATAGRAPAVLKLKGFEVGETVKFDVRGSDKSVQGKIRKFTKDPKGSDYVVIENNGRLMGKRIDKVKKV